MEVGAGTPSRWLVVNLGPALHSAAGNTVFQYNHYFFRNAHGWVLRLGYIIPMASALVAKTQPLSNLYESASFSLSYTGTTSPNLLMGLNNNSWYSVSINHCSAIVSLLASVHTDEDEASATRQGIKGRISNT